MSKLWFGLFEGRSIYSKLIKFWTRSNISHVGIILDLEPGTYRTIEVYPNGSLCRTYWNYFTLYDHNPGTVIHVWELPVSEKQYDYAMKFYHYLAQNKTPYNWFGVIGFVIPVFTSNGGYFCSEGAVEGLKFGHIIDPEIKGWKINPDDFEQLLRLMNARHIKDLIIRHDEKYKQKIVIEL